MLVVEEERRDPHHDSWLDHTQATAQNVAFGVGLGAAGVGGAHAYYKWNDRLQLGQDLLGGFGEPTEQQLRDYNAGVPRNPFRSEWLDDLLRQGPRVGPGAWRLPFTGAISRWLERNVAPEFATPDGGDWRLAGPEIPADTPIRPLFFDLSRHANILPDPLMSTLSLSVGNVFGINTYGITPGQAAWGMRGVNLAAHYIGVPAAQAGYRVGGEANAAANQTAAALNRRVRGGIGAVAAATRPATEARFASLSGQDEAYGRLGGLTSSEGYLGQDPPEPFAPEASPAPPEPFAPEASPTPLDDDVWRRARIAQAMASLDRTEGSLNRTEATLNRVQEAVREKAAAESETARMRSAAEQAAAHEHVENWNASLSSTWATRAGANLRAATGLPPPGARYVALGPHPPSNAMRGAIAAQRVGWASIPLALGFTAYRTNETETNYAQQLITPKQRVHEEVETWGELGYGALGGVAGEYAFSTLAGMASGFVYGAEVGAGTGPLVILTSIGGAIIGAYFGSTAAEAVGDALAPADNRNTQNRPRRPRPVSHRPRRPRPISHTENTTMAAPPFGPSAASHYGPLSNPDVIPAPTPTPVPTDDELSAYVAAHGFPDYYRDASYADAYAAAHAHAATDPAVNYHPAGPHYQPHPEHRPYPVNGRITPPPESDILADARDAEEEGVSEDVGATVDSSLVDSSADKHPIFGNAFARLVQGTLDQPVQAGNPKTENVTLHQDLTPFIAYGQDRQGMSVWNPDFLDANTNTESPGTSQLWNVAYALGAAAIVTALKH